MSSRFYHYENKVSRPLEFKFEIRLFNQSINPKTSDHQSLKQDQLIIGFKLLGFRVSIPELGFLKFRLGTINKNN